MTRRVIDGGLRRECTHTYIHTCAYTGATDSFKPTPAPVCGCLHSLTAFAGPLRVFKHSKAACEAEREVEDMDCVPPSKSRGGRGDAERRGGN